MHIFRKRHLFAALIAGSGFLLGGGEISARYALDGDGNDSVGKAGALTLNGADFASGYDGEALKLNGTQAPEVLDAKAMKVLAASDGFSISFLCKPAKQNKYRIVLAQATASPADRTFWIGYQPDLGRFDVLTRGADNRTQAQVNGTGNVGAGQWNLVVASAGNGELRLLTMPLSAASFNGRIPHTPLLGKIRNANVPLTLGGRSGEAENSRFSGEIDDLIFWNRPLEPAEMAALLAHYRTKKPVTPEFSLADAVKNAGSFQIAELPYFLPGRPERLQAAPVRLDEAKRPEYVAPKQIASGDFRVETLFAVPDWKQSMIRFDLGADGFLFDGTKSTLRSIGNEGIGTFKLQPVSVNLGKLVADGRPVRFAIEKEAGILTLRLDGREVYRTALPRDTIGEVAVTAEKGAAEVQSLTIEAPLLAREFVPVFTPGENGTAVYRIPALVRAKDGSLLAFAEARHDSAHDLGDIDIVLKRSTDGGKQWLPLQTVIKGEKGTHLSSVNPGPVVEPESGRIHLFCYQGLENKWAGGEYKLLHSVSDDNGATWSEPADLKPLLPEEWLSFQPGPGHGIVLRHGDHKGRIVVPGWYVHRKNGEKVFASALIYSDDGGKHFQGGGTGMNGSDECLAAELADGSVVLAIRPPAKGADSEFRRFAVSRDGGEHFEPVEIDRELRAPVCQAGMQSSEDGQTLYFSYPGGGNYERNGETRRAGLTLRRRAADRKTWSEPQLIYAGRSGYSDLALFGDDRIGILFEGGRHSSYKDGILFAAVER